MNVYKKIIIVCGILICSTGALYATEEISGSQLTTQPDINKDIVDDLNATSLRFCNDDFSDLSGRLVINSQAGRSQRFCVMFLNNLDKNINFSIGFSKATKDKDGITLCDQDMSNNVISKLIREDVPSIKINVEPHKQAYKKLTMVIPKNMTGKTLGCLSYMIDGSYSKKTGDVFGVLIRKTSPIEINITGGVSSFGRRDDLKYSYSDNKSQLLKVVAGILIIRIIVSIIQATKKKEKHHKKK